MPGTVAKHPDLLLLCVQLSTTLLLHHTGLHYLQELIHLHNSKLVATRVQEYRMQVLP